MAKPTYEPRRIFRNAEWFHLASTSLRQHAPKMRGLFVPSAVLNAFSLELYLKCLIAIQTGKNPPSGHDLRWLFNKLSNNTQDKVRRYFDNPNDPKEIKLRKTLENPQPPIPKDMAISPYNFDTVLELSANAFVQLRYIIVDTIYDLPTSHPHSQLSKCQNQTYIMRYTNWPKLNGF
jgi:hypothetical protein